MPSSSSISQYPLRQLNAISFLIFIVIAFFGALFGLGFITINPFIAIGIWAFTLLLAWAVTSSLKIASAWERAIVLRLGKFAGIKGPGIFIIVPFIDTIPYWLDMRTITSSFKAEQTLTCDSVPVDVDAILFWQIVDGQKAALSVADYKNAVILASQTALRDMIGRSELTTLLSKREVIDTGLKTMIDKRTAPWGVEVISVEILDVIIPNELQSAMSQQAQAERERQARVILGDSERQIAHKFVEAAKVYADYPEALHLRAMNMLYEGMKDKGAMIIVPSSALDSMNLGSISGLAATEHQLLHNSRKA